MLALLTSIVLAQTTSWTLHLCPDGKTYGNDLGCSAITSTVNSTVTPKCPDGYQLVADLAMQPKCARELIDPVK